jgi:hypothetical protein
MKQVVIKTNAVKRQRNPCLPTTCCSSNDVCDDSRHVEVLKVRRGVAVLRVDLLYKNHVQQRDLVQHWQKAAMVLNACKDGHVSLSIALKQAFISSRRDNTDGSARMQAGRKPHLQNAQMIQMVSSVHIVSMMTKERARAPEEWLRIAAAAHDRREQGGRRAFNVVSEKRAPKMGCSLSVADAHPTRARTHARTQ